MGVTGTEPALVKPKSRAARSSRKKRRTEISSSEESSSSSEDEEKTEMSNKSNDAVVAEADNDVEMDVNDDIDELEVPSKEKTQRDALETKLKLSAVSKDFEKFNTGSISSEEWVTQMVTQYGEDIDLLRHSSDFKDSSVAQVAQLLRETRHVI